MGSVVYLLEKDMSKKLLALLVAVSTCCAFGCSDDDSDSCKTGEKRCDGSNAQICTNGSWTTIKCEKGCDKATGVCTVPKDPCTTAGEKRCSGKELQECKDGNWSKVEDCAISCDEAKKECGGGDGVCTATSTSKCTGACSADKKAGYFWSKDTLKTVDCPNSDCTATNGYVQCGELPKCTAESTERCNVACSADKSVGYYWNSKDKKVGERKCPNNDCTIEGTSVKCEGDKGNGERPSDVPATCVKGTSKGMCSAEDKQPYICGDKGEYYKGKCESGTCFECSNGWVGCGATEADVCKKQDDTKCTGEKVQTGGEEGTCCDAANYQASCINENANALICAKGAVKKWTCKDNICSVGSDNKVKCDNPNGTGGGSDKGDTDNLEDCTATSNAKCKAACAADGKGYYWNSKNVVTQDCPAKQLNCLNNNGKIVCIGDVTEETCDPSAKPAPTCTDGNAKVKYCDSNVNKFVVKPCATCVVKEGVYYCDGDDKLTDCTTLDSTDKCKGVCTSETEGLRFSSREGKVVKWTCSKPGEKCEADATGWLSCKK